jgi:hypothetical protein
MQKLLTALVLSLVGILLSPVNALGVETALTVTRLNETAILIPHENADDVNGNSVSNRTGDVFLSLLLPTGSAGSATVTVTAQTTSTDVVGYGVLTKADNVVSLNVGEQKVVGPFPPKSWNDGNGNLILSFTGTGAADVDVASMRAIP